MSGDQGMNTLYLVLCLMLVAGSLISMRLPFGKVAKMAAAWAAIFGIVFILFAFRGEFSSLGARLRAEATGNPIVKGQEIRIPIADDGHFWVQASVNGHDERFLVDSGASITTITQDAAQAAQVVPGMRVSTVETANGEVQMRVAQAELFQLGPIARPNLTIHINDRDGANVLGMNFLSSLDSWRVERNYLVLQP